MFLLPFAAASIATAVPSNDPSLQPDLSRSEALVRADQLFARFDLNQDGVITHGEAEVEGSKLMLLRAITGRDSAPGLGGHTLEYLKARFGGAAFVTRPQFEAAWLAHFDAMDTNHDGILTAAERVAAVRGR
ncbi:hypothetical protein M8312_12155 [Sphingomonas sp. KRR8]|uniref:hypothetical protein n=1 Tax=Sphingomonas sp. KRR8 TaxID=2942996 RepID=UPI00202279FE|nr:hypothetical protein [Sphingomonas sp. KRR8]URD60527.1 hypothetical protein M8312_12155 [Sphingomonas sp. KRR8]